MRPFSRTGSHSGRRARGLRRRTTIAASAGVVALVVTLSAIAYWTTGGSGSATASSGTLSAATISAPGTSTGSVTISWDTQAAMTPASQSSSITYIVERKLGAGAYAAVGSGPCSVPLPFGTSSCTDTVGASGTYTYRVVASFSTSWTAISNEVAVVATLDAAAPTTTISFPANGGLYNSVTYGAGCVPTGICGTATDATGVDTVRVSVQGSNGYWTGTDYTGFSEFFIDATLASPGATSTSWTFALALPPDDSYTIHVQAEDTVGNDSAPTNTSTATFTIDTTVPTQAVTMTLPVNAFLDAGTVYYRGSTSGSFKLADAVTDAGSGPASATFPAIATTGWTHDAETVVSGTGSNPTKTYTSSTYSWTASPSNPATQTIVGADGAGNTVSTGLTFANDSTAPAGGALTVNGQAANGAGTIGSGRRSGSAAAVAGDTGVHEARVGGEERLGPEPEAVDGVGSKVGEEDVSGGEQRVHRGSVLALGVGEVEDDGSLAPVVEVERRARQVGASTGGDREHPPHRIAGRCLDLDDVGTPVGEHATGAGPGDPYPHLDDADPLQHGGDPTPGPRFSRPAARSRSR